MASKQDEWLEWRLDDAMPEELKGLVSRSGKPDPKGFSWLIRKDHAVRENAGKAFFIFSTGEQLEMTWYPCVRTTGRHWYGVFVVHGPSIPRPTIIGLPAREMALEMDSATLRRDRPGVV
jgi:hypothetical protein